MRPEQLADGILLYNADCREVLRSRPDNSVDSVVTDPPYALVSIVKRFGSANAAPAKGNEAYMRASAGFMGKQWDTGDTAHSIEFWQECLRVLKPGGHVVAFAGTRTYHRLAVAIEDAGFEIRDMVQWIYGQGFPKSHDVSKGIDRAAGAEREIIGKSNRHGGGIVGNGSSYELPPEIHSITAPATDSARQWQGWGTALKPANEPICLARKPLSEKTVAANVLKWGTGAINVDGCRVDSGGEAIAAHKGGGNRNVLGGTGGESLNGYLSGDAGKFLNTQGRWPANVITDGSEEVVKGFPDDGRKPPQPRNGGFRSEDARRGNVDFKSGCRPTLPVDRGDSGSAARFFYSAKASKVDRAGSKHPTVKPIKLMQYLARLVTPPGGTLLDPFAGSGTTGVAALREGFKAILCERETEYAADIRSRFATVDKTDDGARNSATEFIDELPLWANQLST
jgi:DNA modification methylase